MKVLALLLVVLAFALYVNTAKVPRCPSYIRVINSYGANETSPAAVTIDFRWANNKDKFKAKNKVSFSAPFNSISSWNEIPGKNVGRVSVGVRNNQGTLVLKRVFNIEPNAAYSVFVSGPYPGPQGQKLDGVIQLYQQYPNLNPVVTRDPIVPITSGHFLTRLYNWADGKQSFDLRVINETSGKEYTRVRSVAQKTAASTTRIPINTAANTAQSYVIQVTQPNGNTPIVNKDTTQTFNASITTGVANTIYEYILLGNPVNTNRNNTLSFFAHTSKISRTSDSCNMIA